MTVFLAQAGTLAGIIGALLSLPIQLLIASDLIELSLGIASIGLTCALMGLVYRYAVRTEESFDLKTGAVGAFALIRGSITTFVRIAYLLLAIFHSQKNI